MENKIINCLGTGFVLINYAFEILILILLFRIINKKIKCFHRVIHYTISISFWIITIIIYILKSTKLILLSLIFQSIIWTIQIIYNIVYNNKYIYPPFFIIFNG